MTSRSLTRTLDFLEIVPACVWNLSQVLTNGTAMLQVFVQGAHSGIVPASVKAEAGVGAHSAIVTASVKAEAGVETTEKSTGRGTRVFILLLFQA